MDIGLLIIRLAVGLTLAAHGSQKLFGAFGGHGLDGTGGFLEMLGFRPGRRHAEMAGLAEFGGGLLLAVGMLTPFAAATVIGVMTVAAISVHLDKGFFVTAGGFEYTFVLAAAAAAIAFTGPGAFSVDYFIGLELEGPLWGVMAIALGLAAAGVQLATRHREPVDVDIREAEPLPTAEPLPEETPIPRNLDVPIDEDARRRP